MTFDPESWSLFYTNLESKEFYNQPFAVRLVVLASGRRQGLTFYNVLQRYKMRLEGSGRCLIRPFRPRRLFPEYIGL